MINMIMRMVLVKVVKNSDDEDYEYYRMKMIRKKIIGVVVMMISIKMMMTMIMIRRRMKSASTGSVPIMIIKKKLFEIVLQSCLNQCFGFCQMQRLYVAIYSKVYTI